MNIQTQINNKSLKALSQLSASKAYFNNLEQSWKLWTIRESSANPLTKETFLEYCDASDNNYDVRDYFLKENWI